MPIKKLNQEEKQPIKWWIGQGEVLERDYSQKSGRMWVIRARKVAIWPEEEEKRSKRQENQRILGKKASREGVYAQPAS